MTGSQQMTRPAEPFISNPAAGTPNRWSPGSRFAGVAAASVYRTTARCSTPSAPSASSCGREGRPYGPGATRMRPAGRRRSNARQPGGNATRRHANGTVSRSRPSAAARRLRGPMPTEAPAMWESTSDARARIRLAVLTGQDGKVPALSSRMAARLNSNPARVLEGGRASPGEVRK